MSLSADAIGAYLQERRINRKIGLEEASLATGISTGVLKTLENNDRERFPAEVYTKGFYKIYAEYLGLNPEVIITAYQQQSKIKRRTADRSGFNTVVTLKGQEKELFGEIARRLVLSVIIVIGCALFYWVFVSHLSSYNPLDYIR